MIDWGKITKEDNEVIRDIVKRAQTLFPPGSVNVISLTMDITAAHISGCELDLDGLLNAKSRDFVHDVAGINRRVDHDTGELKDCFLPRHAA